MKVLQYLKIKMSLTVLCGVMCTPSAALAQTLIDPIELTDEQHNLLYGSHQLSATEVGGFDIHQLGGDMGNFSAVPLVNFELKAATNLMQGNTLDMSASYQTVTIGKNFQTIDRGSYETSFSVSAPVHKYLDFSQAIRENAELCPEKVIDKMIIDGAVGFNLTW